MIGTFDPATHTYTGEDGVTYKSVTTILQDQGIVKTDWYNEEGANRGSEVHELAEMMLTGEATLADFKDMDDIFPYLEAFQMFLVDYNFQPELVEEMFICEQLKYAGTVDLVGQARDVNMIIDLKTGAHQRWHGLQLTGYATGLAVSRDPKYLEYHKGILLLKKDGKYSLLDGHRTIGKFDEPVWKYYWNGIVARHQWDLI